MTDSRIEGVASGAVRTAAPVPPLFAGLDGDPRDAKTWHRAAVTAYQQRNYLSAIRLFQASLRLDPTQIKAEYNMALAQVYVGMYEEADRSCARALLIDPSFVSALVLRGNLAYVAGSPAEGSRFHDQAFALGDNPSFLTGLPHVSICRGESSGWESFAPGAETVQLPFGGPWTPPDDRVWKGEADPEGSVCIYKDGGNGDLFFFARWIPAVAARVGRVFLTVPPAQERLMAGFPGLTGLVRHPDELPESRFVHLFSLPRLLGTPAMESPAYLVPPHTDVELPVLPGLRAGLVWAGSPATMLNHDRSVPTTELLRPLFDVPGIDWVSLQTGDRQAEAEQLPFAHRPNLRDFADTAHLMTQLDLIISVDTAVANLAGAMGLPAWVLPPTFPEFRWGFEGDRTPWYPSLRLFRRKKTGDWPELIAQLSAALRVKADSTGVA